MGYDADRALLRAAGAEVTTLAGCCGLAGNFGMEAGHYDVSVAVAENGAAPRAARPRPRARCCSPTASPAAPRPADLAGAPATTLAQLLASHL